MNRLLGLAIKPIAARSAKPYSWLRKSTAERIAVIGTGYVGLTTGACLAALGHTVVCADIDQRKIALLRQGHIPIHEEGLQELVARGLASGRLSFVLGAARAVKDCGFVFMCLPTPQGADGAADLSYLLEAAAEIGPHLSTGAIVINKSTVPVGSAALVTEKLANPTATVASNPEFLRQGTAVRDCFHPERIVIGSDRDDITARIDNLYAAIKAPRVHVNTSTAELLKYASNAFLATKISYANSISTVSESLGANAHDVLAGMGRDSRIGAKFLTPGPGWGGSCFPKDTQALLHSARQVDYDFALLSAAIQANDAQTERIIAAVRRLAGGKLTGKRIAAWGLTFKAGTDDLRDSPAVRIIARLLAEGSTIHAYDPAAKATPEGITRHRHALDACRDADVLVILTEWPEFARASLLDVASLMKYPKIVDTRGIIDVFKATDLGLQIWSVSHTAPRRPKPKPSLPLSGNLMQKSQQLVRNLPGYIVQRLPESYYTRAIYLRRTGSWLNLKHPHTYSEKIQWLKLYGPLERYANYVDKYEVRRYVEHVIGRDYLVPLLGQWSQFDDIPFDDLPKQFVLKATHGHAYKFVCRDKSKLDMRALKILVDSWTNENFYHVDREPQYRHIRPRLICEAYLEDESGGLIEYKIPCFDGKPHFIQVFMGRHAHLTSDFYDTSWHRLNIQEKGYPASDQPLAKPAELRQMLALARKLSRQFPFVRTDFFIVDGRVYFNGLTFTPSNGIISYKPASTNMELGKLLDLSRFTSAAN